MSDATPIPVGGNDEPLASLRGVGKSYGGTRALEGINLELRAGEVHALCGENGAGKSTLIKILAGSVPLDEGEIRVAGRALPGGDVLAAEAAGIAVIHQELVAFSHLDARDNLFVGREPRRFGGLLLDRPRTDRETRALLDSLGENGIDPARPVGELSLAQGQMVGIARALSQRCRVLILDEPTASLSARETDVLFGIIRRLRGEGVAILYVSHRLEEIFALSDRITVLRDGRHVATQPTGELDQEQLIRLMVGRELLRVEHEERPSAAPADAAPLLEVANLSRAGQFADVSLRVGRGEIVGLAGLVGAGRSETAQAIFGLATPDAGTVQLRGETLPAGSPRAAMARGLALVPEDRQGCGLVLPMSVGQNLSMVVLPTLTHGGLTDARREADLVARLLRELAVKAAGPDAPAHTLSGGNQQKLVLGKWLAARPAVLILDEPTRGVDVGAKAEIYRLIRRLAADGLGVLLISSDLPEVLALSDRVLVMRGGRVSGELTRTGATQEKILALAIPRKTAAEDAGETGESSAPRTAGVLSRWAARREFAVAALLVVTFGLVGGINRAFFEPGNLRDLLVGIVPAAIVGCGLTFVIVTGEIDISVGSLLGLLAAALGILCSPSRVGLPVGVAIVLTLGLSALVGLVNGLLVAVARVPSIIVTLGMLTALRGVTELVIAGRWITDLPPALRWWGTGSILGVRVSILVAALVVAASAAFARLTPLGRRVYAVGSNPHAARLAGLSSAWIKVFVFTLTGLLVGVAAVVSVPQLSVIESGTGIGLELLVVTCAVVGGASVSGGKGTILGTLLAVTLLGGIRTALIFLNLGERSVYWERAIQGGFILAAVLADHLGRRRATDGGGAGS